MVTTVCNMVGRSFLQEVVRERLPNWNFVLWTLSFVSLVQIMCRDTTWLFPSVPGSYSLPQTKFLLMIEVFTSSRNLFQIQQWIWKNNCFQSCILGTVAYFYSTIQIKKMLKESHCSSISSSTCQNYILLCAHFFRYRWETICNLCEEKDYLLLIRPAEKGLIVKIVNFNFRLINASASWAQFTTNCVILLHAILRPVSVITASGTDKLNCYMWFPNYIF